MRTEKQELEIVQMLLDGVVPKEIDKTLKVSRAIVYNIGYKYNVARRGVSQEIDDVVVVAIKNGKYLSEIIRETGLNSSRIKGIALKFKLTIRKAAQDRETNKIVVTGRQSSFRTLKVIANLLEGKNGDTIANEVGLTKQRVSQIRLTAEAAGIVFPTRRQPTRVAEPVREQVKQEGNEEIRELWE
jgi:transcriptional regulator of met regulon